MLELTVSQAAQVARIFDLFDDGMVFPAEIPDFNLSTEVGDILMSVKVENGHLHTVYLGR